jgi:hypothetical protein
VRFFLKGTSRISVAIAGRAGELEIVEAEAAIGRHIFERYLAGDTPRQIAGHLNLDRVLPPRGGDPWRASTINGNKRRANGILQSEIYKGVIVWNRLRMMRDPSTGRRIIPTLTSAVTIAPDLWTARRSGASLPNPRCVRVSL